MNKTQKLLVESTRVALFQEVPHINKEISSRSYRQLYTCARNNGTAAVCFDGLAQCPDFRCPDSSVHARWMADVAEIEKRYQIQLDTLQQLIGIMRPQDIRMLIFKGFSLSRLYPEHKHREFRDLDIYLYDNYDKGDVLLAEQGIQVHTDRHGHSRFRLNGIPVESHKFILHHSSNYLQKKLVEAAEEAKAASEDDPIQLPALENAAYTMQHATTNFFHNDYHIRFRTMVDWACCLKEEGKSWHYADLKELLRHTHSNRMADLMTSLCSDWFGCVSYDTAEHLQKFSDRTKRRFTAAIFAEKTVRKNGRKPWKSLWMNVYKHIRFSGLKKELYRRHE